MRIERYTDTNNMECHECGGHFKTVVLVHLRHLCQHQLKLCEKCYTEFVKRIVIEADPITIERAQEEAKALQEGIFGEGINKK